MFSDKLRIFSGSSNPKLAEQISEELGLPLGKIKVVPFQKRRNLRSLRGNDS